MTDVDFAVLVFVGSEAEETRAFFVDPPAVTRQRTGLPVERDGYVLLQLTISEASSASNDFLSDRVLSLNGRSLPEFDLVRQAAGGFGVGRVPPGFLKKGENRLTFRHAQGQPIGPARLVIQWREPRHATGIV